MRAIIAFGIRPATTEDLPALMQLETLCFPTERFTPRHFRYLLTKANATTLVCVNPSLGKDQVIAYAAVAWHKGSSKGHLISIAVHPRYQGQGVGSQLLQTCEQLARQRGCHSMVLEVREDNPQALASYRRRGYTTFATVPGLYHDGATGYKMAKLLA